MVTAPGSADKTASLFSRLNPVPAFPNYTGPYKVGTVDIELPVSQLSAPSPAPEGASAIHTVQFRIFYPAVPEARGKRITWLPAPQRLHVGAYAQFLGAGPALASVLSFLPRHVHYASIPVLKNASLLRPDPENPRSRWPTAIFSHGLGGNRNTYSHAAGSLASHGVVVFCPEHRDGSAPVSLIRDPQNQGRFFVRNTRAEVPYQRIPHTSNHETWELRNKQIRIRLWELGLAFDAMLGIGKGEQRIISANMNASTPGMAVFQFANKLDIQDPGRVIFAGHSFGAATIVQLVKSTYYADRPEIANMKNPLFTPAKDSGIRKQITEKNPIILLDMWCFPLISATAAPLYNLPLPAYDDIPSAPGGDAILAVESQQFFKWRDHLHAKARILSPEPSQRVVSSSSFERPNSGIRLSEPNFFYVENSAHLSQSDFGILFPWLTKRVFGAENPERCLRLNLRAQLQLLRNNGYHVARTWSGDIVDGTDTPKQEVAEEDIRGVNDGVTDDKIILDRGSGSKGPVDAWKWIDIVGLGAESAPSEIELIQKTRTRSEEQRAEEGEREMEGEMEPALDDSTPEVVKKEVAAAAGAVGTTS